MSPTRRYVWITHWFAVKMHNLDTLFYVRIKLNYLRCEIPPAPLFERGETSLARHFLQLPPFAKGDGGGFSCVGATNIQVMNVYESIKFGSKGLASISHEPEGLRDPESNPWECNNEKQAGEHGDKQPEYPPHGRLHGSSGESATDHEVHSHRRRELA